MSLIESTLHPEAAVFRHVIPAGEPYLFEVKAGQTLRLLDLEGNQAVDTLFFSARNPRERYDRILGTGTMNTLNRIAY